MAVPARGKSAAAREQAEPHRPDPRAPGWADVRCGLVAAVRAWVLAVGELARDPRDAAALAMVETTGRAVEALGEIGRRWVLDEKTLEAERAQAFAEGFAAGQALRGRLSLVSSG